jgi:molybdenum cofactor cytidylyltransferase
MLFIREMKQLLKHGIHYNIIILAAGASKRMGEPKQLLKYNGANLIQHAIDEALAAGSQKVFIVLGSGGEKISEHINKRQANIVYNKNWEEGIASSIREGLQQSLLLSANVDAVILMVCDQPYVTAALLKNLVNEQIESGKHIVAAQYQETWGTPVLFYKSFFPELLKLKGDTGAKKILMDNKEQVQAVKFPLGDIDIDNIADYEMLLQQKL